MMRTLLLCAAAALPLRAAAAAAAPSKLLCVAATALLAKADDPWGLEHKDAYDVLKVPFDASREQIRKAYKARSKELHPDKLRLRNSEAFVQLRKAYDIVGYARSKKKYDKEARKRHKQAPRRAENTLAADLAGDRKPINVVVGRLESGRALLLDEALVSRDGSHEARFEVDGNLRVREAGSRSIVWQTFAKPTRAKHGFGWLLLQHDGNLVLNSGDKGHVESVIWSSNSADPSAAKSYLELDDEGGLRVHRRTADNAYAPCAWGSMGCGGGLAPVRNSIRVLLRSMFYPSALNRKKGVLSSLVGFLRRCVGL